MSEPRPIPRVCTCGACPRHGHTQRGTFTSLSAAVFWTAVLIVFIAIGLKL
jgi:hypothetical protein